MGGRWRIAIVVVIALAGFVGYELWYHLARHVPDEEFTSAPEQFKYGAIGLPQAGHLPYLVWQVMPQVCADKLPQRGTGWEALGLIIEPSHDRPVGFAKRTIGYPVLEA